MKLYKAMSRIEVDGKGVQDKYSIMESTIAMYSRMKKSKSHRCVLDINKPDVLNTKNLTPIDMNVVNKSNAIHNINEKVKNEMIGTLVD